MRQTSDGISIADIYDEMEYAIQSLVRYGYVPTSIWLHSKTSERMGKQIGSDKPISQIFNLPLAPDDTVPEGFVEIRFKDGTNSNKWRVWVGTEIDK